MGHYTRISKNCTKGTKSADPLESGRTLYSLLVAAGGKETGPRGWNPEMAADALSACGTEPVPMRPETIKRLDEILIPGGETAEISIVVADEWQGKGIAAGLLKSCLGIAREQGIKELWGVALAENTQVLALARKLGFSTRWIRDANEYELRIDLTQLLPSLASQPSVTCLQHGSNGSTLCRTD